MHWLDERMKEKGYRVCFMAEYFLPDMERLKRLECNYVLKVLEQKDFADLYLPMWGNALCADRKELDVLGVGAYDGEKLVGLAACSADCDNMWQIDSPYTQMYTREEKISRLNTDIAPYEHFVMAGSMSSFHYAFDDMFKMMVFLYVEPDIRIQRVHKRAIERFGRRVLEGGDMYESHMKFLKDNRSYEEDGSPNMREQKEWMTNMSCVKIELDGATDLESNADIIVNNWSGIVE